MIKIRSVQKYRLFFLSCFLLFFDFNIFVYSRKFSIQYTFQIVTLDSHKLLVGAGTAADCVNFNEFIGKNMKLYELNNDIQLSTKAAANYIRGEVERLWWKVLFCVNIWGLLRVLYIDVHIKIIVWCMIYVFEYIYVWKHILLHADDVQLRNSSKNINLCIYACIYIFADSWPLLFAKGLSKPICCSLDMTLFQVCFDGMYVCTYPCVHTCMYVFTSPLFILAYLISTNIFLQVVRPLVRSSFVRI